MMQRTAMLARATATPLAARALPALSAAKQQQLLTRVSSLGLSARTFSHARVALQAAAQPPQQHPFDSKAPAPAQESTDSSSSSASSTAVAPAQSFSDIVGRYGGWYPFLGLAGVIAVSKEIIILNEELLLVTNFAAMAATLYFALGDTVNKAAEEARAEIVKRNDELSDFQIEQISALIQAHELNIEQVSVLERLKEQHNTLSVAHAAASGVKVRMAARDAVLKRLGDIRAREASEKASFQEMISKRATVWVKKQLAQADAQTKAAMVNFALDVLEGKTKTMPAEVDVVRKLYNKYFDEQLYVKEIEQEKAAAGKQ